MITSLKENGTVMIGSHAFAAQQAVKDSSTNGYYYYCIHAIHN